MVWLVEPNEIKLKYFSENWDEKEILMSILKDINEKMRILIKRNHGDNTKTTN